MYPPTFTLLRIGILTLILLLVLLSQRYLFLRVWRLAGRFRQPFLRNLLRSLTVLLFALVAFGFFLNMSFRSQHFSWRSSRIIALGGLWCLSALFAYLAVKLVTVTTWLWDTALRVTGRTSRAEPVSFARRRFVQTATVVAGAIPFAAGTYGFAIARRQYQVSEIDLPIAGLPEALAGLRIMQLSDIHMSSYMSAAEVRRAVDMANDLRADLAVVTGDFITRVNDPLESCIAELSRLRAPLGVWGCNGNHEIYADVETLAGELFARNGMRLLRQENAQLSWRGQAFNLIGVDYQRERDPDDNPIPMLASIETQVRRDMPNILLSHNPNSFRRAAELGIELMLTGHTHGGQVRVEFLDRRFSPARFLTPYVAGLYQRPLGATAALDDDRAWTDAPSGRPATLYVNRGLGTIGAPVRLGVPPEISLHTLRRA